MANKQKTIWKGKVVRTVRFLDRHELAREGWDRQFQVTAVEFTDGSRIYASCDPEGNGPGALLGATADGQTVRVTPE